MRIYDVDDERERKRRKIDEKLPIPLLTKNPQFTIVVLYKYVFQR